jgi:hypothetical protein
MVARVSLVKFAKPGRNIPNYLKMYRMPVKYSKCTLNIPTFSIPKSSKLNPNWDFWFENIPSGNLGQNLTGLGHLMRESRTEPDRGGIFLFVCLEHSTPFKQI